MSVTIFTHPMCNTHIMDPEHPECPARLHQINDQLIASVLQYVLTFAQGSKIALFQGCVEFSWDYSSHRTIVDHEE